MSEIDQPDFRSLWKVYFAQQVDGVRYEVRLDSNFQHDLVFLSSLLHDSRIQPPFAAVNAGEVNLQINRDCWEKGYTDKPEGLELHIADCRLFVSGVTEIAAQVPDMAAGDGLWLDYLWVSEDYLSQDSARFTLSLVGLDWRINLVIDEENAVIRLTDLERPYLYSERNS